METLENRIAREGALEPRDAVGWILRLARSLEPVHAAGAAHGKISATAIAIEAAARTSRGGLLDGKLVPDPPAYHSPERGAGRVSPDADTWAAAVTLYFALTAQLPFPGEDDREVRRRIFGPPPATLAEHGAGDEVLQGILDRAFHRTVALRLTGIGELREALEAWHPDPAARSLPALEDSDAVANEVEVVFPEPAAPPARPATVRPAARPVTVRPPARPVTVRPPAATGTPLPQPARLPGAPAASPLPRPARPLGSPAASPLPRPARPLGSSTTSPLPRPARTLGSPTASPLPRTGSSQTLPAVKPPPRTDRPPALSHVQPPPRTDRPPPLPPVQPPPRTDRPPALSQVQLPPLAAAPVARAAPPAEVARALVPQAPRVPSDVGAPATSGDRSTPITTTNIVKAFAAPSEDTDDDVTKVRTFPVAFETVDGVFRLVEPPAAIAEQASSSGEAPPPAKAADEPATAAGEASSTAEGPGETAAAQAPSETPDLLLDEATRVAPALGRSGAPAPDLGIDEATLIAPSLGQPRGPAPAPVVAPPTASLAHEPLIEMADETTPVSTRPDAITVIPDAPIRLPREATGGPARPAVMQDLPAPAASAGSEERTEQSSADKPVVLTQLEPAAVPAPEPLSAAAAGAALASARPAGATRWAPIVAGLAIAAAAAGVLAFRQRLFAPSDPDPGATAPADPPAANSGSPLPANSGSPLPANSGSPLPANSGSPLPANSGSPLPANSASSAPADSASSAPAAASEVPSATAATAAAPGGVAACLQPLFPAGTFVDPPEALAGICEINDPRKGAVLVRNEVTRAGAGRTVSDGMREWAVLGWYDMATFAVLRKSCCPAATPVELPSSILTCKIDEPTNQLADLAVSKAASDEDIKAAFDTYTKAARCIARSAGAGSYNKKGPPQPGEDTTFLKNLARIRATLKNRP